MKSFYAAKAKTSTDANIVNTYGLMAYSVGMSIDESSSDEEQYTGHLTMDDWEKLSMEEDTDHKCPVCRIGGNWNHEYLMEPMGMDHDMFIHEMDFDDVRTREQDYRNFFNNGYSSSRSVSSSTRSVKSKSSSDDSSDSSSSRSQSNRNKVKKCLYKINAEINEEKLKKMEEKIEASVRQLNSNFSSLSANQVSEEKLDTLDRNIKVEMKHVENKTKSMKTEIHALHDKLEQRNGNIDKDIKQNKDFLESINEESKQNKSEIRSFSTKLDENNDKVKILTNTIIDLQSTIETLQKQAKSNLTLQKNETLEQVQIPPPSGQEVHLTVTQDSITEDSIPVVNRTLTVNENVSSAQLNKDMKTVTTQDIEVTSNAKVIIPHLPFLSGVN